MTSNESSFPVGLHKLSSQGESQYEIWENEDLSDFLTPQKLTSGTKRSLSLSKKNQHYHGKVTPETPTHTSKRIRRIVYSSDEDDNVIEKNDIDDNLPVSNTVSCELDSSAMNVDDDADFFEFDDDEDDPLVKNEIADAINAMLSQEFSPLEENCEISNRDDDRRVESVARNEDTVNNETEKWLRTVNDRPLLSNTAGNPLTLTKDIAELKSIEVQLLDKLCAEVRATLDDSGNGMSLLQRNRFHRLLELRDTLRNKIDTLTNLQSKSSAAVSEYKNSSPAANNILNYHPLTPSMTPRKLNSGNVSPRAIEKKKKQISPLSSSVKSISLNNKTVTDFLLKPPSTIAKQSSTISKRSSTISKQSPMFKPVTMKPSQNTGTQAIVHDDTQEIFEHSGFEHIVIEDYDDEAIHIPSTIVQTQFPHLGNQGTGCTRFRDNVQNDGATREFGGYNFSHSKEMMKVFREKFGLKQFRQNQLQAINACLLCNDCFVLMPTGGGKSLCYQLPAILLSPAVTVVISPLISLIQDQTQRLDSLGISAAHLTANNTAANNIYTQLSKERPSIKLLYVTPEKLTASARLMSTLEMLYERKLLARFVIDEVHCVSQWGHDFRPDYKRLSILRENFPAVPMILLTATATARVRFDILTQLKISKPKLFIQSFNRPNLAYEVRHRKRSEVMPEIISFLKERFPKASGIVYCLSRNDCENVATGLSKAGLSAIAYHAGLPDAKRLQVHEKWLNDKCKVICATIAFGMGIDKPNCRFVIHHSLPKSVEGYYQETGRAGRDGKLALCILYFNYQDKMRIRRMIEMDPLNLHAKQTHIENLNRIVQFCMKGECRRAQLLDYFGEIPDKDICKQNKQSICDNCSLENEHQEHDMTREAQLIVSGIKMVVGSESRRRANFTMAHFADVFKGSMSKKVVDANHTRLEMHGKGKHLMRNDIEILIHRLMVDGYLAEDFTLTTSDFTASYLRPGRRAEELLQGRTKIKMHLHSKGHLNDVVQDAQPATEDEFLVELREKCKEELVEACKSIATEHGIMKYTNIMNVEALTQMTEIMPQTEFDMLLIPHVTHANFEKYGTKLLEITQRYGAEKQVYVEEKEKEFVEENFFEDPDQEYSSPYFETKTRSPRKRKYPFNRKKGSFKKWKKGKRKWKQSGKTKSATGKSYTKGASKSATASTSSYQPPAPANFMKMMALPQTKSRSFLTPNIVPTAFK